MKRTLTCAVAVLLLIPAAPAEAATLFKPAVNYAVTVAGNSPTAEGLASGDFDHDGHLDLALTDQTVGAVKVLPGKGDGTFGPAASVPTGAGADGVTAADLDRDGHLDLVASNGLASTVSVRYGDGAGFTGSANYPVGSAPGGITVADFNLDGRRDFVVAATPASVFLATGSRGFTSTALGAGRSATGIGSGDFDGDGVPDVVVGDGYPAGLQLLRGKGDGTFAAPVSYPVPGLLQVLEAFRIGDVNHDGVPDAVGVTSQGQGLVWTGRSDGTLAAPRTFDAGPGSDGLAIDDLNADGLVDLAVSVSGRSEVAIHLGDGSGGFTQVESHPVTWSTESVEVADFTEDGQPDLVLGAFTSPYISVLAHA